MSRLWRAERGKYIRMQHCPCCLRIPDSGHWTSPSLLHCQHGNASCRLALPGALQEDLAAGKEKDRFSSIWKDTGKPGYAG